MNLKSKYAHVLWFGGGTDCGKTTAAGSYAEKHGFQVYHYDRFDLTHHKILAESDEAVKRFLEASYEERWIQQTPETLFQRTMTSFHNRFPLVLSDLDKMGSDRPIVIEGFGLIPELISTVLTIIEQALILVPTKTFKTESFNRRGKPSFKNAVSDPEKGYTNLFTRDMLIVQKYRDEVPDYGYRLVEVESQTKEEMVELLEEHFRPYLEQIGFIS